MTTATPDTVPLSTGQIAETLGWSVKRAARWLDGLAEHDPSIIVRVRGRRMTTLASLRRVCPDVAKRFASDRDIAEIREEQEEQADEIKALAEDARAAREFRRKAHEWLTGLERRVRALEGKAA